MENLKNLDKLPQAVKGRVADYMEKLLKLHGDNILSIFIYGSVASGDFVPGISDVNSALVLKGLDFEDFKKSLRLANSGIRKRIAAPLFLTSEYIKTSLDTFPIEFLEMKQNHIIIYGQDFLKDLKINSANIRFICEEQLKGKLIRIRQAYLEAGLRKRHMKGLLAESLNSLAPIFRGLLYLKGINPPNRKEDLIKILAEVFTVDTDIFTVILRQKASRVRLAGKELEDIFKRYIEQIQRLADISDKL